MEKLFRGVASSGVILGCALVWSWSDMAFLLGAFYHWRSGSQLFVVTSVVAGLMACGVGLLLCAGKPRLVMPVLTRPKQLFAVSLVAMTSSLASIGGAAVSALALTVAGSIVSGVCFSIFIAFWFGIASLDGSSSAIVCMSLGIATGIAMDAFMMLTMRPLPAAIVSAALPLLNVPIYFLFVRDRLGNPFEDRPLAMARPMAGRGLKCEFFGLSLILLVGIAVAEIGFSFMNYQFSLAPAAPLEAPWTTLSFFIARGFGALLCFAAIGIFCLPVRGFFWVGTMAMSLAFALMPFFESIGVPLSVCNGINCGCFALVAIFEIAVASEVAYARHVSPLGPVCIIMFFLTGVAGLGVALSVGVDALGLSADQYSALTVAVGYATIIGLFATVSAGQRYLDPSTGAATGRRVQTELERQAEAKRLAHKEALFQKAELTERERQIAEQLIEGASLRAISSGLGISENTVKTHMQNIYRKIEVHSRAEIVALFALPEAERGLAYQRAQGNPKGEGAFDQELTNGGPGVEEGLWTPGAACADASGAARLAEPLKQPALSSVIERLCAEYNLTEREGQVFELMARGYRNCEIEDRLVISPATVRTHVAHIYAKMNIHSHSDLAALVKRERG